MNILNLKAFLRIFEIDSVYISKITPKNHIIKKTNSKIIIIFSLLEFLGCQVYRTLNLEPICLLLFCYWDLSRFCRFEGGLWIFHDLHYLHLIWSNYCSVCHCCIFCCELDSFIMNQEDVYGCPSWIRMLAFCLWNYHSWLWLIPLLSSSIRCFFWAKSHISWASSESHSWG